jgi:predicted RNase H-like HicB family nuclease
MLICKGLYLFCEGKSYDECLKNITEALGLCIEYRAERGEEIPDESKSRQVLVAL